VGDVRVKDFSRSHAHYFIKQRSKTVKGPTVNRGLAVIKNMLTFAIEKEIIEVHPLARFHMLPEEELALRIPTLEEERRLVAAVIKEQPTIGAYVGILGETGARREEGLRLQWPLVNLNQRLLTIEETKNGKVRHIPLSDYAIELLHSLTRIVGCPYIFARLETMDRYREPRGPFEAGRKKAGLEWVGFHDLRHFRATQWIINGVDLRTVQELMGHRDIKTTMRYAHFAPRHASRSILEAQKREAAELAELQAKNRTTESGELVSTQQETGNYLM
jgi:integrase